MAPLMLETLLFAVLAGAVYTDWRWGKIRNKMLFPAIGAGLALNAAADGTGGVLSSVAGAGLGLGLLLLPFVLGGMGAGDAKLMCAVGAIAGAGLVLWAFIWAGVLGGAMALVILARKRQFALVSYMLAFPLAFLSAQRSAGSEEKPGRTRFPYALAIAGGTAIAWCL